jgi:hypothetical protein
MKIKKKTAKLILFFNIGGCLIFILCIACIVATSMVFDNLKRDEPALISTAENFCKRFGNRELRNVYINSLSNRLKSKITAEDLKIFEAEFFQCKNIEIITKKYSSHFSWGITGKEIIFLKAKVDYFRDTSPGELKVEIVYEDGSYKIDDFEIEKYLTDFERQEYEELEDFD